MIGWRAGVGSYHVGRFEGVPLATDATRDTETKTRVLLYSHTQLEKEEGREKRKTEREKKELKVKYKDRNSLYTDIKWIDNMCHSGRALSCDV